MKYVKKNGVDLIYPYTINDLKKDNSNTSFPDELTEKVLNEFEVYEVIPVVVSFDYTKNNIEGTPNIIDNQYYQNWIITDATEEEITQRINGQWNIIRVIRNENLKDSDWTQLSDSPLSEIKKQEWSTYRQSLRDITNQEDPFNIIWPTKPQ